MILSIETATSNCSVALHTVLGEQVAIVERNEPNIHASQLFVFINDILLENGISRNQLKAVAVSKGPGSYTGLRIGVSAAKGLCYSLGIPLLSVSSLQGMAHGASKKAGDREALLIPMIDARRMEVYNAVYDWKLNEIVPTQATIIDAQSFVTLSTKPCYFFGDGMPKCKEVLAPCGQFFFIDAVEASASSIGVLAQKKFVEQQFESLAYFEPYYLKEFVSQNTFHKK